MSSRVFLSRLVFGLCAGLFVSNAIHAEDLSASQRLNGANTRKAFAKAFSSRGSGTKSGSACTARENKRREIPTLKMKDIAVLKKQVICTCSIIDRSTEFFNAIEQSNLLIQPNPLP